MLRLINDERHITAHMGLVPEALLHLGPQGPEIVRCHRHIETAGRQAKDVHKGRRACQSTIVVSCGAATRVR